MIMWITFKRFIVSGLIIYLGTDIINRSCYNSLGSYHKLPWFLSIDYKLYQNDWYWDVWYFMKNIKNTYHLVIGVFCFELEGTYVNLLIWWFENNWLLRLWAIIIQIKFDVIMDLLKRRKLNKFAPDEFKCYNENVKHQGFFQSM